MKRIATLIALLFLALVGCAQPSQKADQRTSPYGLSGTVTMAEYMSQRYASFDRFNQGVKEGAELPKSLKLYDPSGTTGYAHDEHIITETWNALCDLHIDLDAPAARDEGQGAIIFDFDSYSEIIAFPFLGCEYADFADDAVFPVEEPDKLRALVEKVAAAVEEEEALLGDKVPYENGAYLWDADGDGTREHMWVEFCDNGDEAPSSLSVRVFGDKLDASGYIERAYEIDEIESGTDDKGPYLVVRYLQGDYYRHDHIATCTLRVVGDELRVDS